MEDMYLFQPIPLTDNEIDIFKQATFFLYTSYFEPIALAKRKANDSQYRYIAITMPKYEGSGHHFVIFDIYKPTKGRPYITKSFVLDINSL